MGKILFGRDNPSHVHMEAGMLKKERYFNRELEKRHIKARFTIFHRLTTSFFFFSSKCNFNLGRISCKIMKNALHVYICLEKIYMYVKTM